MYDGFNALGCGIFYKDVIDYPHVYLYDSGRSHTDGCYLDLYSVLSGYHLEGELYG